MSELAVSKEVMGEKPVMRNDTVLIASRNDFVFAEDIFFGTDIKRSEIKSITFLDTLSSAPAETLDISENQDESVLLWVVENGDLYDAYIAGEGGVAAPQDCSLLFSEYSNMTELNFGDVFETDGVTNMYGMFMGCEELSELDVSDFDTSNVINMMLMFDYCKSLMTLDVSNFDTSNVTNMMAMFEVCSNLTTLDVSNFDTEKVSDMSWMFFDCSSLIELNMSGFDTAEVTDMNHMFAGCSSLISVDVSKFDTSKVHAMIRMFAGCSNLQSIGEPMIKVPDGASDTYMFYGTKWENINEKYLP